MRRTITRKNRIKNVFKKNKKTNKTNKRKNKKQIGSAKAEINKKNMKLLKTQNLKKVNCSPKPKDEINNFSCYSDKIIYKLKERWNARHPDAKITSNNPKEIHSQLTNYLSNVCNKESCWLKQTKEIGNIESDKDSDITDSFAPQYPIEWEKNPNEWLSSIDIMNVMKQYEKAYKCFDFIGPSPIDFDTKKLYGECVWDELCNFSLEEQLKNGKYKIGMIFNTDPHNKPGQHWISMFINIKTKTIFFFDSTGDQPAKEIKIFVDRIIKQGRNLHPKVDFKFDSNEGIEHQYGNTECGIYSLFFIVHMLEDKITDHYLKTHKLKDEYMQQFRKVYFNDPL